MAGYEISEEFETILNLLNLKQFYPDKLSRDNLYQITQDSLSNPDERKSHPAAKQFINNITRYNYHARNIQNNEMENTQPVLLSRMGYRERARRKRDQETFAIHPLEVTTAVFLCCDPTARQDLVMHLWGCKLAVPFVFQFTKDVKPHVYLWPLRCLIGQFHVDNGIIEMPLINKEMKSIAMMRVGENDHISKSFLLNCLIGGPEKSHPIFFHRNSEGSKRNKSKVAEGMIEIGWYLTTESYSGNFDGPRLFINVRGNVEHLCQQRKFIGQLATVTIVLTTLCRLENTVVTVKDLLKYGSRVILLLSDPTPDEEAIDEFLDKYFKGVPDTKFDIVTIEGCMLSEILVTLTHNISKQEVSNVKEVSLSDFVKNLSAMEFAVDEVLQHYVKAFETTNNIVSIVREANPLERKKDILPLQENYWKSWSNIDRDYWRFDQLDQSEKKKHVSKENLAKKLRKLRNEQYRFFTKQGLSKAMTIFIISVFRNSTQERKVFLRMLKLELDNLSRTQLLPLDKEYQKLINETINASEHERAKINQKLSDIDEHKTNISFGLEHMIRETGQLFEACESQPEKDIYILKNASHKIEYKELPKLACYLMMEGYPVEILDGEACSVPLLWVKSVLDTLPVVLQEKDLNRFRKKIKIHVVSVLGIQSSGKSTFLNTILGFQFAVSAGRCTRGAFMQGVRIDPSMKEKIDADYLLAIDTEGLRAAELVSDDSRKHDNELSTFVIGLADTTVINLMGENATYLQENLPIAVHAFLRMNLVGLHPRCTIVHHNVDKRNREKLIGQGRILESVLNKLTNKACELEKIPHRSFQDIIEFSISRHTDYIPALFEGEQPMAPVSVGYSKEAVNVRNKIIEFVGSDSESSSLSYFARHIENLWNAIKKDRFVYEFRTTLEAEARLELDQKYSSILMKYLTELGTIVDGLIPKLTSKKQTYEQVEKKFLDAISSVEKKCKDEFEHFISKAKRRAASCYEQWKEKCLGNLVIEMEHHRNSATQQFRDHMNQLHLTVSMDKIKQFFDLVSDMSLSSKKSEEECFERAWRKWVISSSPLKKDISVLRDTAKAVQDVCPSHKHLLAESMIEDKTIQAFEPSKEKHLNHCFHTFSEQTVADLYAEMISIKMSVEEEYMKEVTNINLKKMPYTDRHPKQILLRVWHHLSDRLNNEDKQNEIANQFKIDLLVCIAGSIVKDFEETIHSGVVSMCSQIKSGMKHMLYVTIRETSASELVKVILEIIRQKVLSEYPKFISNCIISALKISNWQYRVLTKEGLFGNCLYHIIHQNDDKMLSVYLSFPRSAVFKYMQKILKEVIQEKLFVPYLEEITERISNQTKNAFEQESINEITFAEAVERMLHIAKLSENMEELKRYEVRKYQNQKVSMSVVKDSLKAGFKQFVAKSTEELTQMILNEQNAIISVCADILCKQLVGCEQACPFCNEICKYSDQHSGIFNHECFVHRPVGCKGYYKTSTHELSFETCPQHYKLNSVFEHLGNYVNFKHFSSTIYPYWCLMSTNQTQPSIIWKWIFVNKWSVLERSRRLKFPSNLPKSWAKINKKDVLRAIRQQFHLW